VSNGTAVLPLAMMPRYAATQLGLLNARMAQRVPSGMPAPRHLSNGVAADK